MPIMPVVDDKYTLEIEDGQTLNLPTKELYIDKDIQISVKAESAKYYTHNIHIITATNNAVLVSFILRIPSNEALTTLSKIVSAVKTYYPTANDSSKCIPCNGSRYNGAMGEKLLIYAFYCTSSSSYIYFRYCYDTTDSSYTESGFSISSSATGYTIYDTVI